MKLNRLFSHRGHGHALMLVMVTTGIALATLSATWSWNATSTRLNDRNNHYFSAMAAAEAATEKIISDITSDYYYGGATRVNQRLGNYAVSVPTFEEHAHWANYSFEALDGTPDSLTVAQVKPWAVSPLISQYRGLSGYASSYEISAVARDVASLHAVRAAVQQHLQMAAIPLFQFAIFYNMDLEINPGPNMTVNGRVHSNYELYAQPGSTLTFEGNVTAAGEIHYGEKAPDDPSVRTLGRLVFSAEHDAGVGTLNLPMGVENTPQNAQQILALPPMGESTASPLSKQRLANKSDLTIIVTDGTAAAPEPQVSVMGRTASGSLLNLGYGSVSGFVSVTNASFYNARESKTVKAVEINVGGLRTWTHNGNTLTALLGRNVNSVYVADLRAQSSATQPGVRLVNGRYLPDDGLTVSTPNPLYVQGHFNAPLTGSSDTSLTKPAALMADAITVLSPNWTDANSTRGLSYRTAAPSTVNAAFLAGIVPTAAGYYSGGVENYPRFLENWSGRTFTYNGSMVVMFPSQTARGKWQYGDPIYTAPNRNWAFDLNFLDPSRLPPLTPQVATVIRGEWHVAAN
jgi:hypothetical protein